MWSILLCFRFGVSEHDESPVIEGKDGDEEEDAQEVMRKKYGRNSGASRSENITDLKRVNQEIKRRFKNKQASFLHPAVGPD